MKKWTTRQSAFMQLPWVNQHKKLPSKFVKMYSLLFNQFILTLFQRNKYYTRQDPVCVLLGSFNLFVEYLLQKYSQDKTYNFSQDDEIIPYVDACRALVLHILSPTQRFHTDSFFPQTQYMIVNIVHYEILYQPLQISEKFYPFNFVGEKTSDLFSLIGLFQWNQYPFFPSK